MYSTDPIFTEPWFAENAWYAVNGKAHELGVELSQLIPYEFTMDDEHALVTYYDSKGNAAIVEFIRQPRCECQDGA